jgi:hypothetical protein
MWTDRLVTIFLAAIAALLTAYFFQPSGMQNASAASTTSSTVGNVYLLKEISTPGVKTVIPLGSPSAGSTVFAVQSADHVYVYHVTTATPSN